MVRGTLSEDARGRLREAVARAEARTEAQLVVVIAESCGSYGVFATLWAALGALFAGAGAVLAAPWFGAAQLVLVEGIAFLTLAAALAWKPLLMRLVPQRVRRAHARLVAEHQFAARVGGRTERGIGLLLFLALAERQVFILPDTGVTAAIETARWNEIVARLAAMARAGALEPAIAAAIGAMASLLETKFPPETPTENPLADDIVELGRAPNGAPPRP